MTIKKVPLVLSVITLAVSFVSWWVLERAITVSDSSTWAVPILFFSLLFIVICLDIILIKEIIYLEIIFSLSFALSLIFAPKLIHITVLLFSMLILLSGIRRIRKDLNLNVKISLWKSIYTGKARIIFAFALAITSQYYFVASNMDGTIKVPQFKLDGYTSQFTGKILSSINPAFKSLQNQDITVDEFILQTQKDQIEDIELENIDLQTEQMIDQQYGNKITPAQKEQLKTQARQQVESMKNGMQQNSQEMILKEGRKQLAQITKTNITGSEKMADIFSGMINEKINDYFSPKVGQQNNLFEFVFSIVLILTVISIGSFLSFFYILIAWVIFKLMVRFGYISVSKKMVEMEVIE